MRGGKLSTWTSDQRSAFILITHGTLPPQPIPSSPSRWRRRHMAADIPQRSADRPSQRDAFQSPQPPNQIAPSRRRAPTDSATVNFSGRSAAPSRARPGRSTDDDNYLPQPLRSFVSDDIGERPASDPGATLCPEKVRVVSDHLSTPTCISHVMS